MGHVVVKLKIVVDDGVVCMVELEQMLQRPCLLLVLRLDMVDLDGFEINCCPRVGA